MNEIKIGKSEPLTRVTPYFIEEDQEQKKDLDSQFKTIKDNMEEFNFPLKLREL